MQSLLKVAPHVTTHAAVRLANPAHMLFFIALHCSSTLVNSLVALGVMAVSLPLLLIGSSHITSLILCSCMGMTKGKRACLGPSRVRLDGLLHGLMAICSRPFLTGMARRRPVTGNRFLQERYQLLVASTLD